MARLHRAVFWQLPHGPLEPPLDEVAHHGVWPLSTVVQAVYFLPLYAKGKTQAPPWPVPPVVLHTFCLAPPVPIPKAEAVPARARRVAARSMMESG